MTTVYLGLGSNREDRRAHLQSGVDGLSAQEGVLVTAASPVYESEAHTVRPDESQPAYLNAVLEVETTCSPEALLQATQEVEGAEGRRRSSRRWAPRVLDIDLLAYDAVVRDEEDLVLPHPRLAERRFVLRPWADLAPDFVVPHPFEQTVRELLERCPDSASIVRQSVELEVPQSVSSSP